jgi:Tol biopolymer transport system component
MGEVFRGVDTRLNRTVAIKVLSPDCAAGREFRLRFQVEARAVSSLNHPHICTLFDVGQQQDVDFLVMEYVEGQTLRDRLRHGPLPLEEALLYAAQILSALDHAHRKGVVHRDLKPANIMLTGSGATRSAKLLDFGLAMITQHEAPAEDQSTQIDITAPDQIVGTPQYFAPEILQGKHADARSDLHAFGAVLYEMLTGRAAFQGDSRAHVLAAVVRDAPPPVSSVRPDVAPALSAVLDRCLAKNPDERWQSAADLAAALRIAGVAPPAPSSTSPRKASRLAWLVTAGALAAVAATLWLSRDRAGKTPAPVRFIIAAPDGWTLVSKAVAPSPDGRAIAFTATGPSGESQLWLRPLQSREAQPLAGTEGGNGAFWSPDGRFIGFFAQGKLKKLNLENRAVQAICNANVDLGATWNATGDIVFSPFNRVPLHRVAASGGEPVAITTLDTSRGENSHRWPHFLSDGRHFVFTTRSSMAENTTIAVGSLDSKEIHRLVPAQSNAVFVAPGYLLYAQQGALLARRFDLQKLALVGDTEPVAGVGAVGQQTPSAAASFAVSANGTMLAYQAPESLRSRLLWFDRTGKSGAPIGPEGDVYTQPRLSPDGKQAAVVVADKDTGNRDIYAINLDSGVMTRLTSNPANDWYPVWSPDSTHIVFSSDRTVPARLYRKAASGEGDEEPLGVTHSLEIPGTAVTDWSADGRFLIYGTGGTVWALPLADRKPFSLIGPGFSHTDVRFSPDGKWLAYASNETGSEEIYVKPFSKPGRQRVSAAGGHHPAWSRNGKELFYVSTDGSMMALAVKIGETFEAGPPHALFRVCRASQSLRGAEEFYDVAADGKQFLMSCSVATAGPSTIHVELNWSGVLGRGAR